MKEYEIYLRGTDPQKDKGKFVLLGIILCCLSIGSIALFSISKYSGLFIIQIIGWPFLAIICGLIYFFGDKKSRFEREFLSINDNTISYRFNDRDGVSSSRKIDEFRVQWSDVTDIDIKTLSIDISTLDGKTHKIKLDNYAYDTIKEVKGKFEEFIKEKLKG